MSLRTPALLLLLLLLLSFSCAEAFSFKRPLHSPLALSKALAKRPVDSDDKPATAAAEGNCEDGVCSIDHSHSSSNSRGKSSDDDKEDTVAQLVKLGWDEQAAREALAAGAKKDEASDADSHAVAQQEAEPAAARSAAATTADDGEAVTARKDEPSGAVDERALKVLVQDGWSASAAKLALQSSNNDLDAARIFLEREERLLHEEFEKTVQEMVANGWHEMVARSALLRQRMLEGRKVTAEFERQHTEEADSDTPVEVLDEKELEQLQQLRKMHPSLKASPHPAATPASNPTAATRAGGAGTAEKRRKPAAAVKKEDVIFEATEATLQRLVIDSPVPVVLDVYADWCGPCKMLTPILEKFAMNLGGAVRLVKVDGEKVRSIAQVLDVRGYPTVFGVRNGRLDDRFSGVLGQAQLQDFFARLLTGTGPQSQGTTPAGLESIQRKFAYAVGAATVDAGKKARLNDKLTNALDTIMAAKVTNEQRLQCLKVAHAFVQNVLSDISNEKYRQLNSASKAFANSIAAVDGGVALLNAAGFKNPKPGDKTQALTLAHKNAAILSTAAKKIEDYQSQVLHRMKASAQSTPFRPPERPKLPIKKQPHKNASLPPPASAVESSSQTKEGQKEFTDWVRVAVQLPDGSTRKIKTAPKKPMAGLLSRIAPNLAASSIRLKIRSPAPANTIKLASDKTVGELAQGAEFLDVQLLSDVSSKDATKVKTTTKNKQEKIVKSEQAEPASKQPKQAATPAKSTKKSKRKLQGGIHTLASTGILSSNSKKHNEYFGGDSTVVEGGGEGEDNSK